MIVREYRKEDIPFMIDIWNEVVRSGIAFPQEDELTLESGEEFFASQVSSGVAEIAGEIRGLYIVHPNNVGRVGHIANASYAVASVHRGKGIGRALVEESLAAARRAGFKVMQFNAVIATNAPALHLYRSLGFRDLGIIPGGFRLDSGDYLDICPMCRALEDIEI